MSVCCAGGVGIHRSSDHVQCWLRVAPKGGLLSSRVTCSVKEARVKGRGLLPPFSERPESSATLSRVPDLLQYVMRIMTRLLLDGRA
jgi:hypothetical protein